MMKYSRAKLTFPADALQLTRENIKSRFSSFDIDEKTLGYIKTINTYLKHRDFPTKAFCFSGKPTSAKDFIVQCLLKSAVDGGLKVSSFCVDALIKQHFDKRSSESEDGSVPESSMLDEFEKSDVFSLYFGNEIQFRVGESYVTELIRGHILSAGKKVLILNTSLSFDELGEKYSDSFKSMFAQFGEDITQDSRVVFLRIRS